MRCGEKLPLFLFAVLVKQPLFSSPNGLIVLRRSFRADFNHISQTDSLKVYLLMINGVPQIQYMNPKLY